MYKMLVSRHKRTAFWCLGCAALVAAIFLVQVSDRPGGAFQVRPTVRVELRARVTGFLKEVEVEEGDRVSASKRVALLEVPDLASKTEQKRAEVRESRAKLRLLELGPRAEEVMEQRYRVERARKWRELARQDLAQARTAHKEELGKLDKQQAQNDAELAYARYALQRDRRLYTRDILPQDQYKDRAKQFEVRQSMVDQTTAQRKALEARGTQREEAELARRDKELADAQATLTIMELGTRPEEIEAERARLARLQEEQRYLEKVQRDLPIVCPVDGVVTTPRLKEKIGQYLKEGELICTVDRTSVLEVEVSLDEQEVERIEEGSEVELRPRSFVFKTFRAELTRIAPMVRHGVEAVPEPGKPTPPPKTDAPGTVTLYCEVKGGEGLLPGMSGFARISCPRRSLAAIALERGMRMLRPEYWW
jgi:multidrug efflux pump subunit AcrA (membrane-fusion protein)